MQKLNALRRHHDNHLTLLSSQEGGHYDYDYVSVSSSFETIRSSFVVAINGFARNPTTPGPTPTSYLVTIADSRPYLLKFVDDDQTADFPFLRNVHRFGIRRRQRSVLTNFPLLH